MEIMSIKPSWLFVPEWLLADTWHFPYAYKTFRKYIPRESLVLEVGFGSGRILTRIAREQNCKCVGVEVEDNAFPSLSFFLPTTRGNGGGDEGRWFLAPLQG